jgi:small subunit ribosomal protein S17
MSPQVNAKEAAKVGEARGFRRTMTGRVVSNKMDKTVVVECVSARKDPLYGKYVRSRTRYKAHDETNIYKVGDQVEIQEHRPISRDKRFIVTKLLKKFVEE